MKSLVFCLGSLREPRVHAGLRRDFPLLFLVTPLLCGQLLGALFWLWALPAAAIVVLLSRRGAIVKAGAAAAAIGILSVVAQEPPTLSAVPTEHESVLAVIQGEPRRPRVGEIRFKAAVSRGTIGSESFRVFCTAVDLPWRNATNLRNGSTILLRAKFKPLPPGGSPFAFASTLRRDGIQSRCTAGVMNVLSSPKPPFREVLVRELRAGVESVLGDGERAGLLLSMGLGVRDVLSERTEAAFKATGLAHLLVVSGYQVTLVFGTAYFLLQHLLRISHRLAALRWTHAVMGWSAFAFSLLFIYLVGIEGSTLRAGLALLFCLVARHSERRGGMFNGILASLAIISVLWPGCAFEPGVELTYAALAGIALGARRQSSFFLSAMSVTFFATAATALVCLLWFGTISMAGFVLNPLVAPALGVISCEGGFLAIALHSAGLDPYGYGLRAVSGALEFGRDAVISASEIPFASFEPEGPWYVCAAATLGLILGSRLTFKFNQYVTESGFDFRATERCPLASKLAEELTQLELAQFEVESSRF